MPEQHPGETDDQASLGSAVDIAAPAETGVESSAEAAVRGNRDVKGRFAPGHTGNAGGRPKAEKTGSLSKVLDGIVDRGELGRALWNLAMGKTKDGKKAARPNLSVQLAAIQVIYDRLEGKPLQSLRHEGEELPTFIIMHGRDAAAARDAEQARSPETNGHATNGNGLPAGA